MTNLLQNSELVEFLRRGVGRIPAELLRALKAHCHELHTGHAVCVPAAEYTRLKHDAALWRARRLMRKGRAA